MTEARTNSEERDRRAASGLAAETRKTYVTPRLTRWGTIPRVTQADPGDFSGPVPLT